MKNRLATMFTLLVPAFFIFNFSSTSHAQQQDLAIAPVVENVFNISGSGGNVAVFIGEEATFLVDDKYAKNAKEIHQLVEAVGGAIPKYLVNTHFHGDHSGGNEYFGEKGTIVVGHHNVHKRLSEGYTLKQFMMVAPPVSGHHLPKITYAESVDIYVNSEKIKLIHMPDAHTDTDTVVHFTGSNVVHLGDLMFNGFFPFIDTTNGGSLKGVIRALTSSLELMDSETKIIPGHGPIASRKDVEGTISTLTTAYKRLKALKDKGLSLEQAIEQRPLADIEKSWGGVIFDAERWIGIVWVKL